MDINIAIKQAARLRKEGKTKESLESFRLLSQQFPEEIIPWLAISSMSRDLHEREMAINKVLHSDPNNKTALKLQAKINDFYNQQNQISQPIEKLSVETQPTVAELAPQKTAQFDPVTEQLHQAVTLKQNGKTEQALSIFQNIVQHTPEQQTSWWGIYTIAQTHTQKQNAFINLLKLMPDNPQIRNAYLGRIPETPLSTQNRKVTSSTTESASPIGLIIFTWLLLAVGFIPVAGIDEEFVIIAAIISFFSVIGSVLLIRHDNRAANINGWIILIIWILLAGIGFMIGFGSAFI